MPREAIVRLLEASGAPAQGGVLLESALTHRSWVNENPGGDRGGDPALTQERLEFLGDAVLGLAVARRLFERLPRENEGLLSKAKAHLVSAEVLARHARALGLGEALRLGRGEELGGGRERDALLADALEAVLGAVFLAGGWELASRWVDALWAADLEAEAAGPGGTDSKSVLQEASQKFKGALPVYQVEQVLGPDHDRVYEITVLIQGREYGRGRGRSKKEAEQTGAAAALAALQKEKDALS